MDGKSSERYRFLDMLRGFSLLSMIVYHLIFDIWLIYGASMPWFTGWPGYIWQQSICWVFILVSGVSLHFTKSAAKHGITVLLCGMTITLVTILIIPGQTVRFGILHFIGLAILLTAPLRSILHKISPGTGLALSFFLFLFTKTVPTGFLGLGDIALIPLPQVFYNTPFLFPFGLPQKGFSSSDYFPLIPWLFLYWSGYFGWQLLKKRIARTPTNFGFLEWIGQHSLIIYMAHQPVLYGILMMIKRSGLL